MVYNLPLVRDGSHSSTCVLFKVIIETLFKRLQQAECRDREIIFSPTPKKAEQEDDHKTSQAKNKHTLSINLARCHQRGDAAITNQIRTTCKGYVGSSFG
jgi:hypothetical protein